MSISADGRPCYSSVAKIVGRRERWVPARVGGYRRWYAHLRFRLHVLRGSLRPVAPDDRNPGTGAMSGVRQPRPSSHRRASAGTRCEHGDEAAGRDTGDRGYAHRGQRPVTSCQCVTRLAQSAASEAPTDVTGPLPSARLGSQCADGGQSSSRMARDRATGPCASARRAASRSLRLTAERMRRYSRRPRAVRKTSTRRRSNSSARRCTRFSSTISSIRRVTLAAGMPVAAASSDIAAPSSPAAASTCQRASVKPGTSPANASCNATEASVNARSNLH